MSVRRTIFVCFALLAVTACNERPSARDGGSSPGPGVTLLPEHVRVVVEADSGKVEAPFEIADDPGASGGRCVLLAEKWAAHDELHPAYRTKEDGRPVSAKLDLARNPLGRALVPNGTVEVPFEVKKAGRYAFWARAWFHCSCGDTFYLSIDRPAPVDADGDGEYEENPPDTILGSTHRRWKWFTLRGRTFELAEGPHVARIFPREDGLKIDQLMFAEITEGPLDPYVPQGIEESCP